MLAYVINKHGKPLMPCHPAKARTLLKEGKAKVVSRKPFVIQLLYGSSGYKQPIILGVDSGYLHVGLSAVTQRKEVFGAELALRSEIVKLNSERRAYRRTRRNRKTWYRQPRFLNRQKTQGWLAPSLEHKLASHLRMIEAVRKLVPIAEIYLEVAAFDLQKIKNLEIAGVEYQNGEQKEFWNTREYVLHRDDHTCQNCHGKSKDPILETHHLESRKTGGNRPDNLITLCSACHQKISRGKLKLQVKPAHGLKAETFMTMVRWRLLEALQKAGNTVFATYGYLTKSKRIELSLPKSHSNDAFVIAGGRGQARNDIFQIQQNRRHNRSLQTNRKGFRPSVRRQRYAYQPGDLVLLENTILTVKGMFNYGQWVRLVDATGNIRNAAIAKVGLLKYQRGFAFAY